MNILALDPSLSSTGYCVLDTETREILNINKYNTTEKNGDENQRIYDIAKLIERVLALYDIKEVALEDGFVQFASSSLKLGKLRGALIFHAMNMGIKVYSQEPKEARKNLGLKGNAKKEEVAKFVIDTYPDLVNIIGPYSDKQGKNKTSDMYDSVGIGIAHLNKYHVSR